MNARKVSRTGVWLRVNWKWFILPFLVYLCVWFVLLLITPGILAVRSNGLIYRYTSQTFASKTSAENMGALKIGRVIGHTPNGAPVHEIVGQSPANHYIYSGPATGKHEAGWVTYRVGMKPPKGSALTVTSIQVLGDLPGQGVQRATSDARVLSSLTASWRNGREVNVPYGAVRNMLMIRLLSTNLPGIGYETTIATAGRKVYIDEMGEYMGTMIPVSGPFAQWILDK